MDYNYTEEKNKLKHALDNLKITKSQKLAEEMLAGHIGFEKEKDKFQQEVRFYIMFRGNFRPLSKVVCYAGPPGIGKTTFVQTLSEAMGRDLKLVPCAGLENSPDFSILGSQDKPSLLAWAVKELGSKNLIILFDEAEKVKNEQIQAELIELFEKAKNREKFKDPYFKEEIDLTHITFFLAVNYKEKLATKLKDAVEMRELQGYTSEEKLKILKIKKENLRKSYKLEEQEIEEILSDEILEFLVNKWIQEKGARKLEQALNKIVEEYVYSKKVGKQAFQGHQQKWIEQNILPFWKSSKLTWSHYGLFASFGVGTILLIIWAFRKLLKKEKNACE